jgi:carbamoyltransferase
MNILGISLGHDTNFALIEDGTIVGIMEAERFFRQKRYKLECGTLEHVSRISTFQHVNTAELERFLEEQIAHHWGRSFDGIAVQNQGRIDEYTNLQVILKRHGFSWQWIQQVNHHLSHASLAFYTSPFPESIILSYDGTGNDGQTLVFHADGKTGINYLKKDPREFGKSYNNVGYLIGIRPEICGTSSGKTMGLCSYGSVRDEWLPYADRYVANYRKLPAFPIQGIRDHGKGARTNSIALRDIPELKKYLQKVPREKGNPLIDRARAFLHKDYRWELTLPGPENRDAQDLAQTVQHAWTEAVIGLLTPYTKLSENLCIVGGCALNGITNYRIQQQKIFPRTHFVPNPSDCGLASGAALHTYWRISGKQFRGYEGFLSPYLGLEPFDADDLPRFKQEYPHRYIEPATVPKALARLVAHDRIVGVIRGRYEIGPRALGNRSILCNPLNKDMREILNAKVKHREWYRPFAPMVAAEDAQRYFDNTEEVPYMSVICNTRPEWREKLPSITHVDGTARIQTVRKDQHEFIWKTLKEFEKITGVPIMLNTSFNPGGEPILNYLAVGLDMLKTTDMDAVLIDDTLFVKPGNEGILESI